MAPIDVDAYARGVLAGDRTALGRAITLVESTRPDHREQARALLVRLAPRAGGAHRIGVTGPPGAGKSTFLDALGARLTAAGHRVAVLAVDPSSTHTGGSILGDKTRMGRLAVDDAAFVRPSPNAGVLGGVAAATREAIVVVEAADFDIVFVETVGVGQSETSVASMVDTFLLLTLGRTGDSLQGIKRGVLELADVIAVNKADGRHVHDADAAARELTMARHLVAPKADGWVPPVLTCSALEGAGLDEVWQRVVAHRRHVETAGAWEERRRRQDVAWMWATIDARLLEGFRGAPAVRDRLPALEDELRRGVTTPAAAADELLALTEWTTDGPGGR